MVAGAPEGGSEIATADPARRGRPRRSGRQSAGRTVVTAVAAVVTAISCAESTTEPAEVPRPTSLSVDPPTARLSTLGDTVSLEATVRDQDGRIMSGVTVRWSSTDAVVVTVDGQGLVTAIGYGSATVNASVGAASGSATVLVTSAESDREALEAFYVATDGPNWIRRDNWSTDAPLARWQGIRVDSAGQVVELSLGQNALYGPVPVELGNLPNLEVLLLRDNSLEGALPPEVTGLKKLRTVDLSENRLTGAIPTELGSLRNLTHLNLSRNRLTEFIPDQIGDLHRLRELDLSWNRLSGLLPSGLGGLPDLTRLAVSSNRLTGGVPGTFLSLDLLEFRFGRNDDLCAPGTTNFIEWAKSIRQRPPSSPGRVPYAGPFCNGEDVRALELLYSGAGGKNWTNSTGWLEGIVGWQEVGAGADLKDWFGVTVDSLGRVHTLDLTDNGLVDRLWGLDGLKGVVELKLGRNRLSTGVPDLGDLSTLQLLDLSDNDLYGHIPEGLGNLQRARVLNLSGNRLVGAIPAELGNLSALRVLDLSGMRPSLAYPLPGLEHALPAQLGRLSNLEILNLSGNRLRYAIPREFGDLSALRELLLSQNELSGELPTELGELGRLERLDLEGNPGLTRPLPLSLTSLRTLEELGLSDTGLCVPRGSAFVDWLAGKGAEETPLCAGLNAYLMQAVQSLSVPVPLVAGEPALLRVFVASPNVSGETMPPIRARLYHGDTEILTRDIMAGADVIPAEVDEGSLETSVNAEIPGWVIQPGLGLVLEIDPDRTLEGRLDVAARLPETGRLNIDVSALSPLELTVIPFLFRAAPDSSILDLTANLSARDDVFWAVQTLLPVGEFEPAVHEPVTTLTNRTWDLAWEAATIRRIEGGTGHYMATMAGPTDGPPGTASRDGWSSYAVLDPWVIAQQLGSNLGLYEAPCGGEVKWSSRAFPNAEGWIGDWGYDRRDAALVAPHTHDLMSNCEPGWISGYHFTRAFNSRLAAMEARVAGAATVRGPSRGLLVWGRVEVTGALHLEPSFVVNAPAWLPEAGGDYRLTGSTAAGSALFSLDFDLPRVAGREGGSGFAFVLPVEPGWSDSLASLTLSGPGGSVTLDENSDRPTVILRDSSTGQVRAILRDLPAAAVPEDSHAAMLRDNALLAAHFGGTPASDLTVLISRGLPREVDWDR
ncbi:leucine-rich repeat domain-containing protein [Candidatus Palauibacter sp.]|uniref:leucine-rich repeat domain-containing protein n=1 Tax=Candidatus Palauibacter sp. TaxID=3101350 RepID=UPI003B5CD93F